MTLLLTFFLIDLLNCTELKLFPGKMRAPPCRNQLMAQRNHHSFFSFLSLKLLCIQVESVTISSFSLFPSATTMQPFFDTISFEQSTNRTIGHEQWRCPLDS